MASILALAQKFAVDYESLLEAIRRGHDQTPMSVSETKDLAETYLLRGISPSEMFPENIEVMDGCA